MEEGKKIKGGVNDTPMTPRPEPPKGQGSKKYYPESEIQNLTEEMDEKLFKDGEMQLQKVIYRNTVQLLRLNELLEKMTKPQIKLQVRHEPVGYICEDCGMTGLKMPNLRHYNNKVQCVPCFEKEGGRDGEIEPHKPDPTECVLVQKIWHGDKIYYTKNLPPGSYERVELVKMSEQEFRDIPADQDALAFFYRDEDGKESKNG